MLSKLMTWLGYNPKCKPEVGDIWSMRINVGWSNEESIRIQITEINNHSNRIKYDYIDDEYDVGLLEHEMSIANLYNFWTLESPADLSK